MLSSRLAILLGVLLLMAVPIGVVQGQEAAASIGTAVISDSAHDSAVATNGTITYILTGLTPPPADKALEGWLVSDDGSVKLSTGVIEVAGDGSVHQDYTSPTGEDLIAGYDKVVITEEPVPDDDPGPSDVVLYSHAIPSGAMAHIRHLLSSWPPPDATKGILTHLKEQLDVAILHANLAKNSTDLDTVKTHTHHVINILEGTEGANYDASFGDPGDGFGALNHAADRKHGPFAASAATDDDVVVGGAALVDITGKNAADWATLARDTAVNSVLTATNMALAQLFLGPGANSVISNLEAARNGFDTDNDGTIESIAGEGGAQQAYVDAQKMATYTLTAGPPASVGPGTPGVGDPAIPRLAKLALIAGLVLLAGGSALMVRSRRSRIRV